MRPSSPCHRPGHCRGNRLRRQPIRQFIGPCRIRSRPPAFRCGIHSDDREPACCSAMCKGPSGRAQTTDDQIRRHAASAGAPTCIVCAFRSFGPDWSEPSSSARLDGDNAVVAVVHAAMPKPGTSQMNFSRIPRHGPLPGAGYPRPQRSCRRDVPNNGAANSATGCDTTRFADSRCLRQNSGGVRATVPARGGTGSRPPGAQDRFERWSCTECVLAHQSFAGVVRIPGRWRRIRPRCRGSAANNRRAGTPRWRAGQAAEPAAPWQSEDESGPAGTS